MSSHQIVKNSADRLGIKRETTIFDLDSRSGLNLRVHVSSSPQQSSIERFVEFMIDEGITDVFNFCHPNPTETPYDCDLICQNGIHVHHLSMNDGSIPDSALLEQFDTLIDSIVLKSEQNDETGTVLFHCEAGLGRAPTMLAYLMISRFGWKSNRLGTITYIRSKRRNALNFKQLNWIQSAKIKKYSNKHHNKHNGCVIA
jgi:protein tyrosine phosphatase type IVA